MHWRWKNYPTAWAGMYSGCSGSPTIILEAVADYDLWIWHAHFGLPGSNNDINVLEASHLFANLAEGKSPPVNYMIRGKDVERIFGVLQSRWAIIKGPARFGINVSCMT